MNEVPYVYLGYTGKKFSKWEIIKRWTKNKERKRVLDMWNSFVQGFSFSHVWQNIFIFLWPYLKRLLTLPGFQYKKIKIKKGYRCHRHDINKEKIPPGKFKSHLVTLSYPHPQCPDTPHPFPPPPAFYVADTTAHPLQTTVNMSVPDDRAGPRTFYINWPQVQLIRCTKLEPYSTRRVERRPGGSVWWGRGG